MSGDDTDARSKTVWALGRTFLDFFEAAHPQPAVALDTCTFIAAKIIVENALTPADVDKVLEQFNEKLARMIALLQRGDQAPS